MQLWCRLQYWIDSGRACQAERLSPVNKNDGTKKQLVQKVTIIDQISQVVRLILALAFTQFLLFPWFRSCYRDQHSILFIINDKKWIVNVYTKLLTPCMADASVDSRVVRAPVPFLGSSKNAISYDHKTWRSVKYSSVYAIWLLTCQTQVPIRLVYQTNSCRPMRLIVHNWYALCMQLVTSYSTLPNCALIAKPEAHSVRVLCVKLWW